MVPLDPLITVAIVFAAILTSAGIYTYTHCPLIRSPPIVCRSIRARVGWPFTLTNTGVEPSGRLIATWSVFLVFALYLVLPTGGWSCYSCPTILIGSLFRGFLHSLKWCPASQHRKQTFSQTRRIDAFSDKVFLLVSQSESLVLPDAGDLAAGVARRSCRVWFLSGLRCYME